MEAFHFRKIKNESELKEVFRLRYKVYCEEWGFERAADHPEGLEYDEFDNCSVHFIAIDRNQRIVGTLRLILSSESGFPIERHCKISTDLSAPDKKRVGEISRLAVSKEYRKRKEDQFIYQGVGEDLSDVSTLPDDRRKRQEIVCGLYKCMYMESKELSHWYAVMARGLYVLLKRLGIIFQPIGPEIYYHGLRTPYLAVIEEVEREVWTRNPELFKEFTESHRFNASQSR